MTRTLECDAHGRSPWSGQVICTGCGAVWRLDVRDPPTAPNCTCGKPLGGPEGTARAICAQCYQSKVEDLPS
jgi:hypothetical protein